MNKRLLLASPCKGNLPHDFMLLYQRLATIGIPGWDIDMVTEAQQNAINLSRNVLAHEAIKRGYDRLLMRDLDNPVDLPHIARILSHDVPIVSGLYCVKKPGDPFWLGIVKKDSKPDANGLQEADFLPTGFLSISVAALKEIAAFHPDREFYVQTDKLTEQTGLTPTPLATNEVMTEFFPIGVNGPRTSQARLGRIKEIIEPVVKKGGLGFFAKHQIQEMLGKVVEAVTTEHVPGYMTGEDYYFSVLAAKAGVKQYVDVGCVVGHRGTVDFPVSPDALPKKINRIPVFEGDTKTW